jgi:hypothetical protein
MMTSLAAFRTCKHHKHPRSRKSSPRCYCRSTHRSRKMTARPMSTVAWKTLRRGGRLRMALCFTSLPLIINAKASSFVNTFPEGVDFDTDSFPVAIDSGSTYCLSDRRSDFEGDLTKVNVKIQGILESKGISKWKGTVRWKVQDDEGKEHVFTILNTLLVETPLPFCILSPQHLAQEHRRSKLDTIKSRTCTIVGEDEVELQWANLTKRPS